MAARAGFDQTTRRNYETDGLNQRFEASVSIDTTTTTTPDNNLRKIEDDLSVNRKYDNDNTMSKCYDNNTDKKKSIQNDLNKYERNNTTSNTKNGSDSKIEKNNINDNDDNIIRNDVCNLLTNDGINLSDTSLSSKNNYCNYDNTKKLSESTLTRRIRDDTLTTSTISSRGNH